MVSKMIDVGAKVDIRVVSQMERSTQIAEDVKIYKSQVCDILENGELELLMPIEAGKLMLLSLGIRYEFVFYNKSGLYKAVGQVKERYKTDNRYMFRVELHSPLSKFQRRQFFRLKCIIDMRYFNITKEQARLEYAEDILEELRDDDFYQKQKKARIVDISGGGVRFVSEEENPQDSYVLMVIMLDDGRCEKQYMIVGRIIESSRNEQSVVSNARYVNRVEFVLKDAKVQEEIVKFIFTEERKSRKNDKG